MSNDRPPFRFDLTGLIAVARQTLANHVDGIEISLPFLSISVNPTGVEQKVAREVVIRLADRRVLNGRECCDECIDDALTSLQEIRKLIVDKQVELAHATDGSLYLLFEFMLEAIRQFLTFEQRLRNQSQRAEIWTPSSSSMWRPADQRDSYLAALEMLRAHLRQCLMQLAALAGQAGLPRVAGRMPYDEAWQLEVYVPPKLLKAGHFHAQVNEGEATRPTPPTRKTD